MSKTSSASTNISKRIRRYLYVILVLLFVGVTASGIILWLALGKVEERLAVGQELSALVKSEEDIQGLRAVVTNEMDTIEKINAFFPNEKEVFSVFTQLEKLILDVDDSGVLSFADLEPRKVAGQNTLTLNSRMIASREQLVLFLRKLERLPYIVEVVRVDSQRFDEDKLLVILEVRLYVAEPFI